MATRDWSNNDEIMLNDNQCFNNILILIHITRKYWLLLKYVKIYFIFIKLLSNLSRCQIDRLQMAHHKYNTHFSKLIWYIKFANMLGKHWLFYSNGYFVYVCTMYKKSRKGPSSNLLVICPKCYITIKALWIWGRRMMHWLIPIESKKMNSDLHLPIV